jgi:predicted dienelactone hydrolase
LPLTLVVLQPQANPNGRLVVISHGLWDSPTNFEGWARHLASYGYLVVLPVHPGSDQEQQRAMLAGKVPPPTPEELRLRPMDVSAVLDGIAAGTLAGVQGIQLQSTVVVGHSWGAITALQLAGGRSSSAQLRQNCGDLLNPERTLSWILQCSFVSTADAPPQPDLRVRSVVAVSPPIGLLFRPEAVQGIQARVLLVSGSHDWVVSPDPEALLPFSQSPAMGHRLVLVKGGDHFNMRAPEKAISVAQSMALKKHVTPAKAAPAAVLSPLILAWVNGTFAAGNQALPAAGAPSLLPPSGWGSAVMPMVDVTVEQAAWVAAP